MEFFRPFCSVISSSQNFNCNLNAGCKLIIWPDFNHVSNQSRLPCWQVTSNNETLDVYVEPLEPIMFNRLSILICTISGAGVLIVPPGELRAILTLLCGVSFILTLLHFIKDAIGSDPAWPPGDTFNKNSLH